MITTTEDNFDVDYDIFSFLGRGALIAGGIYALNQSVKEGVFKDLKVNKNALRRNNEVIQTFKRGLASDLEPGKEKPKSTYTFRETTQFGPTEEMMKKKRANRRVVAGVDSEIVMGDGSRKKVRDLFTGGYKGRSAGVADELDRALQTIAAQDNKSHVPFTLVFDDNENLQEVSIKTNRGVFDVSIVDEKGLITKKGSKVATTGVVTKAPDGYGLSKSFGSDVATLSFLADNYGEGPSGLGKLTLSEFRSLTSKFTRHLDRDYGDVEVGRVNPMTVRETVMSSVLNPLSDINEETKRKIAIEAQKNNQTIGGAKQLSENIYYVDGNPYLDDPHLSDTENPRQRSRAYTKYKRLDGTETWNENFKVLYADEDFMVALKNELAKDGIKFGELGKEEFLGNADILGKGVDTSRSIEISNKKMSEAGDFLINEIAKASGLSLEEFTEKLREGRGLDAFTQEQQKAMQNVRLDVFQQNLKEQKRLIKSKKQAMLIANRTDLNELLKKREELADIKNVITGRLRGKPYVGEEFYFEDPVTAKRLDDLYTKYARYDNRELNKILKQTSAELKSLSKEIPQRVLESEEYKKALELKKQGTLTTAINEVDAQLVKVKSTLKDSNLIGLSMGRGEEVRLGRKHKGLFINNIKLTENSFAVQLRREFDFKVGNKIHDPSGQLKKTFKKVIPNLGGYIGRAVETMTGKKLSKKEKKYYKGIHLLATDKDLKVDPDLRNLNATLKSIEANAIETKNEDLLKKVQNYKERYKMGMSDEDQIKFWEELRDSGVSFKKLQGVETKAGYVRISEAAIGSDNIDMGFGGLGFFSERHIRLASAMGASSYAEEIMERRVDKGAGHRYQQFRKIQESMFDSSKPGYIGFEKLNEPDFIHNVFNSDGDSAESAFEMRKKYLTQYDNKYGAAFFDLGEDIDGVRRIPIFTSEDFSGFAGEQIGYKGDVRKFTEIENLTKQIIYETRKGKDKNIEALRTLVRNYLTAMSQMDESLNKARTTGKFTKSGYLVFKSANDEITEYSERMLKAKGTKSPINLIGQISDKKFTEMFGKEALEEYYKNKNPISRSFAMTLREPADSHAFLPMNLIPGGSSDDSIHLSEHALAMIGGDLDQDGGSVGAALKKMSQEQIEELIYGNSENSIKFREYMLKKTQISLKSRGAKSIFDFSLADQRRASFLGKILEKGMVGKVSNALSVVQHINQRLNALSNPEKFHKTTLLVGLLVENTIKGKKQSMEELLNKNSYRILDSIMGRGDFAGKSINERMKILREEFFDKLMLNESAKFADRIRAGENSEDFIKEIARNLGGDNFSEEHYQQAKKVVNNDLFKDLTSDDTLGSIFEYSDASDQYKKINVDAEELLNEIADGVSKTQMERRAIVEEAKEGMDKMKKMSSKVGKNLAMYSLLPAAAFGILGTVFGARSSIESDVEFSENRNDHQKSGFKPFKPLSSTNMDKPRHMKPEVVGSGRSGFQINRYAQSHKTSEMRVVDDTRTFDYFDMQDKIAKGY